MKKVLVLMLVMAMLSITSLAFAEGGKIHLDPNDKAQHNTTENSDYVWWD